MPGAGFSPYPSALVLRSDIERKALFGRDELAKLPPEAYAPAVTLRVYATIFDKARRALAAGHSVIVDAVFAAPPERAAVEQSAKALGVPFHGLFLDRRPRDPAGAGRIAPRRRQRRGRGGRAEAGGL